MKNKKILLINFLSIGMVSPFLVSCVKNKKIEIEENEKSYVSKENLLDNLNETIKLSQNNLLDYLKKNNINDKEILDKFLLTTHKKYGDLPNGKIASDIVFPWISDSKSEKNVSLISEIKNYYQQMIENIDSILGYLDFNDSEKSELYFLLNIFINSKIINKIRKIVELYLNKQKGITVEESLKKFEEVNFDVKFLSNNKYLKNIVLKILNKITNDDYVKQIPEINKKIKSLSDEILNKLESLKLNTIQENLNKVFLEFKNKIKDIFKNDGENQIINNVLDKIKLDLVKYFQPILYSNLSYKWMENKIINEIVGNKYSHDKLNENINNNVNKSIEDIKKYLIKNNISSTLMIKLFSNIDNDLNLFEYGKDLKIDFNKILAFIKKFNDERNTSEYLKNALNTTIYFFAKLLIDNQSNLIKNFVLEKNNNPSITYEEYKKKNLNFNNLDFQSIFPKSILNYFYIEYAKQGLNKTIMNNEMFKINNISTILLPLFEFHNNYYSTLKGIFSSNKLFEAFKEQDFIKILQALNNSKTAWNNKINEIISNLNFEKAEELTKFKSLYNKYLNSSNELFDFLNLKILIQTILLTEKIMNKIGEI